MVHFFIGTKAQFIKMAPIMVEMRDRGLPYRHLDSGQHAELTRSLRRAFGLGEPDVSLRGEAGDIVSIGEAVRWAAGLALASIARRRWLREEVFAGGGICLIHGDTLSTLLGMQMARSAGLRVGHVEAGLTSRRAFDPFPEELIRRWCMRRSQILFAPSEQAERHLAEIGVRGRVVRVGGNTVVDSLRLMDGAVPSVAIPDEPFALATCHRLETITRRERLRRVVALLNRAAEELLVVLVAHKPTVRYLKQFRLDRTLSPRIRRLGMQSYVDFHALLKAARLVLTDGGSIQEECAYLGKPCLILRMRTERPDGLGQNAVVWAFDDRVVEDFLREGLQAAPARPTDWPRPSAEIVDALIEMS